MTMTQPPAGGQLTKEVVLAAVSSVQEPAIGRGLVDLRMIPAVEIDGSRLNLTVELLSPIAPYKGTIERELKAVPTRFPVWKPSKSRS